MPGLSLDGPKGVLRSGWSALVGDYAIACGWAHRGSLLMVCDAAGGVYAFEGTSGAVRWKHPRVHERGALAMSVHPKGALVATAGQDGRVLLWNAEEGEIRVRLTVN